MDRWEVIGGIGTLWRADERRREVEKETKKNVRNELSNESFKKSLGFPSALNVWKMRAEL